jgi:hypothetical protein
MYLKKTIYIFKSSSLPVLAFQLIQKDLLCGVNLKELLLYFNLIKVEILTVKA